MATVIREVLVGSFDGWAAKQPEPWEIVAEREEEGILLLLGIGAVWGVAEIGFTPARTCPVCGGKVPRDAVCLVCHATARDKTQRPMCAPASVDATPAGLKGGTG